MSATAELLETTSDAETLKKVHHAIDAAQKVKATQAGEMTIDTGLAAGAPMGALPTQLGPFNASNITFNNGVPVGGFAQLTLFQNGAYSFTGHFHDSGAVGYNDELVWVVVDAAGVAYTFKHSGHMGGTFTSGSRNDDWNNTGNNQAIAQGWANLCRSYKWRWQANVNWDVAAAMNAILAAIKAAGTVIATVIAIV